MSDFQDWEQLLEASVKTTAEALRTDMAGGVTLEPFYLGNSNPGPFISTESSEVFRHICPPRKELWADAFQKYPGAAVWISDPADWNETFQQGCPLFFNGPYWENEKTLKPWLNERLGSEAISLNLGWDPWSQGLHLGQIPRWGDDQLPIEILSDSIHDIQAFRLSSEIYSLAGASPTQQIGILLSSVTESLRFLTSRLPVEDLLKHFSFDVPMGTDPFFSAAMVQGVKLCWMRLVESMDGEAPIPPKVYGCPNVRDFSTREPWNNLMRLTTMQAGAFFGGASGFRHYPHDVFSKFSKENERLSRNIGLVLQAESGLSFVHNPLEGAPVYDALVSQLCETSWTVFREIEAKGGLIETLQSGWLQEEIEQENRKSLDEVRTRQRTIVGVNRYVGLESLSQQHPLVGKKTSVLIENWWEDYRGFSAEDRTFKVKPLVPQQLTWGFEQMQMESDRQSASTGIRPFVMIFCRDQKQQKKKISGLKEMLSLAGIVGVVKDSVETSEAAIAVCLGGDPDDAGWPNVFSDLKTAGYKKVVWFGLRPHPVFDDHWSPETPAFPFCRSVFEGLEVSS